MSQSFILGSISASRAKENTGPVALPSSESFRYWAIRVETTSSLATSTYTVGFDTVSFFDEGGKNVVPLAANAVDCTPVSASTGPGNSIEGVNGEFAATFSNGTFPRIIYDFQTGRKLSSFSIQARTGNLTQFPRRFKLQGSNDGTNWTTVLHVENAVDVRSNLEVRTYPLFGRIWSAEFANAATGSLAKITLAELQFRDVVGVARVPSGGHGWADASSDSSQGGQQAFANDGVNSWWEAGKSSGYAYGPRLSYWYPQKFDVIELWIQARSTDTANAPQTARVSYSDDGGTTWVSVGEIHAMDAWVAGSSRAFALPPKSTFLTQLALTNPGAEAAIGAEWAQRLGSAPSRGADVTPRTGTQHFVASANTPNVWWSQEIDIASTHHALIDGGQVMAVASAWLQGFSGDSDSGHLHLEARDASGNWLASNLSTHCDPIAWTLSDVRLVLPPATRKLRIGIRAIRVTGTQNSFYIDDFALSLRQLDKAHTYLGTIRPVGVSEVTAVSPLTFRTGDSADRWLLGELFASSSSTLEWYKSFPIPSSMNNAIDANTARLLAYAFVAQHGDFGEDVGSLYFEWRNQNDALIGSRVLERSNTTREPNIGRSLNARITVPPLSRSLRVGVAATRAGGLNTDYLAQHVSLFLDTA